MRHRVDDHYVPVTNPNDVILPKRRPGDPSSAWLMQQLRRRIADSRMRRFRYVPLARRAWYVELTTIKTTHASFMTGQLIPGLAHESQKFWVRARRVAKFWVELDQRHGGQGTMFAVELRHCKVCGGILIGAAAHEYMLKERKPKSTWHYEAGPACSIECRPKPIIRNSKNRRRDDASTV